MFYDIFLDDLDQALTILYVFLPNAVAAHYYELVLLGPLKSTDVWLAGDHLLGIVKLIVGFVIEVAEGTGQVKSAVHSAHVHHSSCIFYPLYLLLTLGLVVEGKLSRLALSAQHAPGIASIGHIEMRGSDEHNVGCASSVLGDWIGRVLTSFSVEFPGDFGLEQLFVHQLEGCIERVDIILALVRFKAEEDISELALHVLTDLMTWIRA